MLIVTESDSDIVTEFVAESEFVQDALGVALAENESEVDKEGDIETDWVNDDVRLVDKEFETVTDHDEEPDADALSDIEALRLILAEEDIVDVTEVDID